jgi:LPXTG-site transpeptidase (sortase) family protein
MNRFASFLRLSLLAVLLAGLILQPQYPVYALTTLTVTPLTWNIIGLDSNNVNVGPNHFPVGARVCNTGGEAATNVTASFQWDSADPYISLRAGTLSSVNLGSLNAGACTDAYFEVEVARNSSAYNHTRRYRINVTAGNVTGTISTPTPRELFVEYLISQNRNAVTDVQFGTSLASLSSVAPGGTMNLMVGNTYYIRLVGYTATQGYEQLESFINIPNTIFQVLSVSTTYTADSSATVSSPNDKAYGDACNWENDPNSPNYRSCLSTGKVGGNITVTYQVRILQVPSAPLVNPQPLSTLIYDFSGSSFHYNADYGVSTRYANIVNASITKSFSPKTINPGQSSTLTFTVNNPGPAAMSGVNFTDTLPSGVTVSSSTITYSGCGSPSPASLTVGATSLSFSNITVAGLGACIVAVNVTASTDAIYNNTSGNLFINSTTDTGSFATDTLVVSSKPPAPSTCATRTTMATWDFENYAAQADGTLDNGPFNASSTILSNTPQGVYRSAGSSESAIVDIDLTIPTNWTAPSTGNATTVWGIRQSWLTTDPATPGNPSTFTSPFFEFQVNTEGLYGGLGISLDYNLVSANGWTNSDTWYVLYSADNGATWSQLTPLAPRTGEWAKGSWIPSTTTTTGISAVSTSTSTSVYFRLYYVGAASGGQNANANAYIDNVNITGCATPPPPTISKSFGTDPLAVGSNSQLTFTIANTGANATNLTGVSFVDALPGGLELLSPAVSNTCGGTLSLNTATDTIQLTGGAVNAAASCTIIVNVQGGAAGSYVNTSTNITSTQTGPNTSATPNVGFARDTIDVIALPVIAKAFTANPIFTGETTLLTFTINNPNPSAALSNLSFTDTLPSGLVVDTTTTAPPTPATNTCGGTLTANNGATSISLGGTSTLNAGDTCTITVRVRGVTTGLKENSVQVSSVNGGTGNTAEADVLVKDRTPGINLLKSVGASATGPWTSFLGVTLPANVYYRLVVENVGDVPLNSVTVTDPTVSTAGCAWVDGDGTSLTAPFTLPVANANDDQVATCILGPVAAVPGSNPNTATASGTNGVTVTDSSTATYGTTALTLVKSVTQMSFTTAGDTLDYSYLVTNSGFAPLLGPVNVTDDKATVTCPDVSTTGDGDNWLDIGESLTCTATYTVTAGDVAAGFVTNTASATTGGVTSNLDSETVSTPSDLIVSKNNNVSGSVAQNGTFNWTITVSNIGTGSAPFADGAVILSDPLPGADGYYPQGALTITPGATPPTGTINCSITGSALTCAASGAVTLPAGASFSVTFAVTPSASGNLSNTATVDPNLIVPELNEANNTASNTVTVIAPPSIAKSFSPNPIVAGGTSTLTFTLTNPNATTALTGVAFTDTYPTGMTNNTPLTTSNTCGGTLTAAAGGSSISLIGGSIPANGSCTITVVVTTSTFGTNTNTSGSVSSTNGGTGNTAAATLTVFDAQPFKSLVATSESFSGIVVATERVAIGEMVRYRLVTRIPQGSFTNVQLRDGIPTGLQFLNDGTAMVAFICNGGAACMTSSTLSGAGLVINGSSGSVSPAFVLPGAAIIGGPFVSGTDVTFSFGNVTNSDVDADSEFIVVEFNALVLNVNTGVTINQGVNNQTGASNTNNRQNDVTLLVNGATVGSTSPNMTVAIAEPAITFITKSVSPAVGPFVPGDTLLYTLSYSNNATGNNATTAFDVVLTDTFDSNLTLGTVNVSSNQGASCAGGNIFSAGSSTVGQLVTVTVSCLDPGRTVTVTVAATITTGASSGTTIPNSASLTYTSLPGAQGSCSIAPFTCTGAGGSGSGTGERNGSGGPGADTAVLNNYAVASNAVNVAVAYGSITVTKDTVPDTAQDFGFTGNGPGGYNFDGGFSLDDDADGTLPNTLTFNNLIPGNYSVMESTVSGWFLTGLTCTDPDNGSTTNLGTATATIDLDAGENVSCTFTNTQWITSIVLTKTPTLDMTVVAPSGVANADDTVTYAFSVENTGNVTITNIVVIDPLLPTLSCTIASLAPGATASCLVANNVYTLTQADIDSGSRPNTATATGKDPANSDATDQDTQTTTLVQIPAHTTTKTETSTGPYAVGDTISYNIVVTNTGNVTLTGVTASDSSAVLGTCTPAQPATLAPRASMTCPASHVVTQADVDSGSYVNTATGDSDQTTPSTDTVTVTFAQNPAINIAKTPPTRTILSGDTANFTLTVTNTGNVTLSGVTVTDAQCTTGPTYTGGDTNNDSLLQLTETWTYSCSVSNVTANFTNTANVSTTQGATDSDSADVIVTILEADLSLDKSVSNSTPLVATNIDFTLSVTNSGPDTATGVQVMDVIPSGFSYVSHSASQGTYASGTGVWSVGTLVINQTETLTITVTVNISGSYTNYAEITASDVVDPDSTPNNGSTDEDDDDSVTVTPTQNDPTSLTKTVSGSNQAFTTHPNVAIGEIVTHQISVTVPSGIFDNARLVDTMERGLAYMDCVSIDGAGLTTSVAGSFASVCSTPTVDDAGGGTTVDVGRRVTYDFGTLTNSTGSDQTLVITYRAVVLDSAGNVSGVDLENSAVWAWSGGGSLGPVSTSVNILEPDLSITKTASASLVSVGSEITITLRIQHTAQNETNAYDVVVTDILPAELEYVAGTLECVSGAQDANVCNYNAGTRTITAIWNAFTLGGGNGQVTFRVRVVSLPSSGITNVANVAWSSMPGDVSAPQTPNPVNIFSTERDYDPASQVDVYGASDMLTLNVFGTSQGALLPATGFAPKAVTDMSNVPSEVYTQTGGLTLEIPSLGISLPIVGVPLRNGEWNVSWLGNQAGWLEGSAFPSWNGNSVLTSHVYSSSGLPGPFINLNRLKHGDRIIIHAYGQKYFYEVRVNLVVEPNDASVFRHEEKSWLTLVTCREYDEKTNAYKRRVVVLAVLVGVER